VGQWDFLAGLLQSIQNCYLFLMNATACVAMALGAAVAAVAAQWGRETAIPAVVSRPGRLVGRIWYYYCAGSSPPQNSFAVLFDVQSAFCLVSVLLMAIYYNDKQLRNKIKDLLQRSELHEAELRGQKAAFHDQIAEQQVENDDLRLQNHRLESENAAIQRDVTFLRQEPPTAVLVSTSNRCSVAKMWPR
jgi:hypothetical protein